VKGSRASEYGEKANGGRHGEKAPGGLQKPERAQGEV
jgi:hypothetical protein